MSPQCLCACPTDVLEMVVWFDCRAGQIACPPRTEDCVRCKSAYQTDFLSVRAYPAVERIGFSLLKYI